MRRIYDCFCFFNELDLLELRLNILSPYVDYFVISEASVTHTGVPKPYYFEENKQRYSKFLHKIIHLKIEDTPNDFVNLPVIPDEDNFDNNCRRDINRFIEQQTNRFNRRTEIHYGRDFYQKECIRRGLKDCTPNDLIISSDCDEIPNPYVLMDIKDLLTVEQLCTFNQTTYYYYLNLFKEANWGGSRMGLYGKLKDYSYNELRAQSNIPLDNGGWHFSFMGGPEKVKTKIQSYSAQEMNNSHVIASVENNIAQGIDPFFRGRLVPVEIDGSYPTYLIQNLNQYKHLIK